MENNSVTYNRFKKTPKNIQTIRREVWILEDWLGVHPFPKYKHQVKYIKDITNSQ